MAFSIVIPARYASQRLPGKPLLDIAGKPMIQRVYEQAQRSSATQIVVATDDSRILEAVEIFGGNVVMTSAHHPSGTDRLAEVAELLNLNGSDIIVNLQGDEPLLPVEAIEQVANNLRQFSHCGIATLCETIGSDAEIHNPNAVKVVRDIDNLALYFSRASVPYCRDKAEDQWSAKQGFWQRHLGLYAYRVEVLHRFVQWAPSELEKLEKLEQLRALQNGIRIHCDDACVSVPAGVDTEQDLALVRKLLSNSS